MKTLDFGKTGHANLAWNRFSIWIEGLSMDIGWFSNQNLIGIGLQFFEWAEDWDGNGVSGITLVRFQLLRFLFAISAHWRP